MLFNSWLFLVLFLPVTFLLYWFVFNKSLQKQNYLLLVSSYVFYGYWNWKFLALIFISSITDYYLAQWIQGTSSNSKKRRCLYASILVNLSILGVFKYYNFFLYSLEGMLSPLNIQLSWTTINIVLPVGISFYTFQTLGYVIDVYKGKIEPEQNWLNFFTFVSFFPQLVAGPIEKAKKLLPQVTSRRHFTYEQGTDALRLILWGLFLKVAVADNVGRASDFVFSDFNNMATADLLLAPPYFIVQIYCDFAGYSTIAMGVGKLFGFELSQNFKKPFFSTSIQEFWSKWHITLNKWFEEYVFLPLIRKWRAQKIGFIIAYFITFSLIGLWHGPEWTYVLSMGTLAVYFIPRIYGFKRKKKQSTLRKSVGFFGTMLIIYFHLIIYRSDNLPSAGQYMSTLLDFKNWQFSVPEVSLFPLLFIIIMFFLEWKSLDADHPFQLHKYSQITRYAVYFVFTIVIIYFMDTPQPFAYFQF